MHTLVPQRDNADAANPAPVGSAVCVNAGFDVIRHNCQPDPRLNLKTVAILIADPNCLRTPSEQFIDRVGGADVSKAVAERFSGYGAKPLIRKRLVDAQIKQLF